MTQNAINNTASILAVDNLTLDGNTIITTDTDGDLVITPNGTGVTTSTKDVHTSGVSFDTGTNVLANYVGETAWTPQLEFGGATTGPITYATQVGKYLRIGNFVQVYINIVLTSKGSATGAATLTGFPFTATGNRQAAKIAEYSSLTFTAGKSDASFIFVGATATISLRQSGDGVTVANLGDGNFANGTVLTGTFGVIIT